MIFAIIILAASSYIVGYRSIHNGYYKPSIYSRAIWLLIALNSFVGVVALQSKPNVLALSTMQVMGCLVMLIGAWKHSTRTFGKTEYICTCLLICSVLVWFAFKSPILNVLIGIIAHFVGGIPSLASVIKKPARENFLFWLFFASASLLTYITADKSSFQSYLYPMYFMLFEGSMAVLSSRQFLTKLSATPSPSGLPGLD